MKAFCVQCGKEFDADLAWRYLGMTFCDKGCIAEYQDAEEGGAKTCENCACNKGPGHCDNGEGIIIMGPQFDGCMLWKVKPVKEVKRLRCATCPRCQHLFYTNKNNKIYCSVACKRSARMKRLWANNPEFRRKKNIRENARRKRLREERKCQMNKQ